LHESQSLNYLPWVRARAPNENRHPLFDRLHNSRSQCFEFIPKKIVAFAKATGCGNDIHTILDDPIDARLQIIYVDRRRRIQISRVFGPK
jgi:hypothetical protein